MPVKFTESTLKNSAETGTVAPSAILPSTLSKSQSEVLRKIVTDVDFRKSFYTDPVKALGKTDITISAHELSALARLTPAQYDAVGSAINNIAADGDGTHTLAYAIAFAVVVALLIAMPDPGSIVANPVNIGGLQDRFGGIGARVGEGQ